MGPKFGQSIKVLYFLDEEKNNFLRNSQDKET